MENNDVYVGICDDVKERKPNRLSINSNISKTECSTNIDHNASSSPQNLAQKKLIQASIICAVFMVLEIIAGFLANSLAILTDASHLLSDLSSFLISLFAIWVSGLQGTRHLSFGYHRAEILSALISVLIIWMLTIYLIIEAIKRIQNPVPVTGSLMFITALFGTLANLVMTYILDTNHGSSHSHHNHFNFFSKDKTSNTCSHSHNMNSSQQLTKDQEQNLLNYEVDYTGLDKDHYHLHDETNNVNLHAAYIHALGDLLQNIGVLIAAALIWYNPKWTIFDPLCTFVFSLLVLCTTYTIIRDATNVLMEGTPRELDIRHLREELSNIPNVIEIHDLHVWLLSVGKPSLACHMVIDYETEARRVLREATHICQNKFNILHTTIQTDFSANKQSCDTNAHAKCH